MSDLKLADVCDAIVDCEHKTAPTSAAGYPSIRTTDIKNGRLALHTANRVDQKTYEEWTRRRRPSPGDIILAREAPVGEVGIVPLEAQVCLGQRTVLISPDRSRVDPRYLLYLLITPMMRQRMLSRGGGSTVEHLNMSDIRSLRLPALPPLSEQLATASLLGALDDKIELNREMCRTIEAIAQALFRSWFVDFDPVVAKAAGRQPFGLTSDVATLFPGEFVESELGPIPAGWDVVDLGEVVDINARSVGKTYEHADIEYIDISSVSKGVLEGTTPHQLDTAPSRARRLVNEGDTIWSCVRPNRMSYYYIVDPPPNLVVSTGFAVLTPRKVPSTFLYQHVTTEEFVDYLDSHAEGSAYPAVRPESFSRSPLVLPPSPLLRAFDDHLLPLRRMIHERARESGTLAELRDILLPRLLSGEVTVRNAEQLVEMVV